MEEETVTVKPYEIVLEYSEFGRTRRLIKCPFCGEEVWGYNWSLAGGGKKCPGCGAIHSFYYGTVKRNADKK